MSGSVPNLERMYECGDVLANAKGLSYKAHQAEYEEILEGVKGVDNCKRLSSQFIARFFSLFPSLVEQSINAMLDLCEDANVDIRKQAIKDLPTLCKDQHIKNLPKIVDVLTQLLQSEDQGEITIIQNSIMTLIRRDTKGAIIGIFSQIHNGEEVVRERALRLIHTKLKTSSAELLSKESQAQIIAEIKKIFSSGNVTAEEFPRLMAIIQFTFLPKSVSGQLEIANMVMKMADLDADADFDYNSTELTDRLLQCATHVLPYFSNQVKSTAFCEYMAVKVLPHYYQLPDMGELDTRNQICKLLAELAVNIGGLKDANTAAKNVFDRLIDYMPLPPTTEDGSLNEVPNLEFTKVECLMFAFHQIAKQADSFLTSDQERLKDFRSRLQYLARGVQGYIKKLKEFLATSGTKASKEGDEEDVKIKQIALRTNENIQVMIRDLFHSPPIYKANIVLSFKPKNKDSPKAKAGDKRKPISFPSRSNDSSSTAKKGRPERQLYMDTIGQKGRTGARTSVSNYKPMRSNRPSGQYNVPQGKYSSKINSKGNSDW